MTILDLPQETVQVIEQVAHKNGQSIQDFITIGAYEKALSLLSLENNNQKEITN